VLNDGLDFTVNVGRGDVYFEDNTYDNEDGAGITIRSSTNPANGAILAVSSSSGTSRLWVGQSFTTPGGNVFCAGYTGSLGGENFSNNYKHYFSSILADIATELVVRDWLKPDRINILLPTGDIETIPTNKSIQIGKSGNNMCISLCSSSSSHYQFIDFTYVGWDFRGRLLYDGGNNKFKFYTGAFIAAELNTTAIYCNDFLALSDKKLKKILKILIQQIVINC
jgi:hypothetical protein